jgi:hypothetical protein
MVEMNKILDTIIQYDEYVFVEIKVKSRGTGEKTEKNNIYI